MRCEIWLNICNVKYMQWEEEGEGLHKWGSMEMPNLVLKHFLSTMEVTTHYWTMDVICNLWRCRLQRPNYVFYMIFSSCHLSALVSSCLLVKTCTKKNCWYPPAFKASLIHFVLWYLCLGWKCHWVSIESSLDFVGLLVWLSLCN
jgi:hypothetical protein